MKKKIIKKDKVIGTVGEDLEAIDFTKIYLITLTNNIRAGTQIRFDTAENFITKVEKEKEEITDKNYKQN